MPRSKVAASSGSKHHRRRLAKATPSHAVSMAPVSARTLGYISFDFMHFLQQFPLFQSTMKSSFVLAALVASAFAQGIDIGAPVEYSNITPGSNITVEVDRPVRSLIVREIFDSNTYVTGYSHRLYPSRPRNCYRIMHFLPRRSMCLC